MRIVGSAPLWRLYLLLMDVPCTTRCRALISPCTWKQQLALCVSLGAKDPGSTPPPPYPQSPDVQTELLEILGSILTRIHVTWENAYECNNKMISSFKCCHLYTDPNPSPTTTVTQNKQRTPNHFPVLTTYYFSFIWLQYSVFSFYISLKRHSTFRIFVLTTRVLPIPPTLLLQGEVKPSTTDTLAPRTPLAGSAGLVRPVPIF